MTFHQYLFAKKNPYLFGSKDKRFLIPVLPNLASDLKVDIAECFLRIDPRPDNETTITVLPPVKVVIEAVGSAGFTVHRTTSNGLVGPVSAGYLPFIYAEGRCVMKDVTPIFYAPWALRDEATVFMAEQYYKHLGEERIICSRIEDEAWRWLTPKAAPVPPISPPFPTMSGWGL